MVDEYTPKQNSDDEGVIKRLKVSRDDWGKCINFLSALSNQKYGDITYEALLISSIIFYTRPFSNNEKHRDVKNYAKVDLCVLDKLSEFQHNLHKKIVSIRNTAIAHIEFSNHPIKINSNIIVSRPYSIWSEFQESHINDFLKLATEVHKQADSLIGNKIR